MSQKTIHKKILSCLMAAFVCLTAMLGFFHSNTKTTASAFTPGIMFGQDYRLKSADTLKYITYSNGLVCTSKQAGNSNQIFRACLVSRCAHLFGRFFT